LVVTAIAVQQVSAATGLFGRPSSFLSRWGEGSTFVQEKMLRLSQRLPLHEIRGGSAEVDEEDSDKPEQLYLPGLLDASVVRSNSVSHHPLSPSLFPPEEIALSDPHIHTCFFDHP